MSPDKTTSPHETVQTEGFGEHGEPCAGCRAPLANDQRYCLNCGRRRAGERVPYAELLAGREAGEVLSSDAPSATVPPRRLAGSNIVGGLAALAGVFVFAMGMAIGLLVRGEDEPQQVAAAPVIQQKPPVVNVTTGGGGGPVTGTEFVSDWPEGESGFTVQLETLPNTGPATDVDTAKTEAESNDAPDVGALNSDEYTSLEPGNYVVYSGVFTGKGAEKKAKAALKKLKKDFPDAKVVEVSSGDEEFGVADEKPEEKVEEVSRSTLQDLESSTGEEQQKKSARLPDTLKLPGAPPPKDDAAPGGGGGGTVIE